MGRKIKIAFSSSEQDSAFTYIHDFGFIPRVEEGKRGFKVVVGGGLGAQPFIAETAFEFLPEDQLIPFLEAGLRVFDRYGEREKRHKARLKFLVADKRGLGLAKFLELIAQERKANKVQSYSVDRDLVPLELPKPASAPEVSVPDPYQFSLWKSTNLIPQKQDGYYAIKIRLPLGNISSEKARELVRLTRGYVADDIRLTISQGILLKYVREEHLEYLYYLLNHLELAEAGADTIADVTACPGTDTCNLGVTNSTGVAQVLEQVIREEYHDLITNSQIHIKISGCMNSCGQHMIANIGFHGSSIKVGDAVVPALQVVLGGGLAPNGRGFIADKVIKLPTKRIPDAVRALLDDYQAFSEEEEYFNTYYQRRGKMYFYALLKPLAQTKELARDEYVDWGHTDAFVPEIGTGECAGISYDVVSTILQDAEERLHLAKKAYTQQYYSDSIYHSYSTFVIAAKALLLSKDVQCNTHIGIIKDFAENFAELPLEAPFEEVVLRINRHEPSPEFAQEYLSQAENFYQWAQQWRARHQTNQNQAVITNYYQA
jgi:sulfite reductase (ferredoxin)